MRISSAFPAGVTALLFDEVGRRRRFEEQAVALLEERGFSEILLPILDYFEPYQELLSSELRDELYRFVDRDGELLALRGDFTPMVARVLAPRLASLEMPLRLFYRGDLVRYQEERAGRLREYYELGGELLGAAGEAADLEILSTFLRLVTGQAPGVRLVLGYAGALDRLLIDKASDPVAMARAISRRERTGLGGRSGALREVLEDGVPRDLGALGTAMADHLEGVVDLAGRLSEEFAESDVEVSIDLAEFAEDFVDPALSEGGSRRPYYDGVVFRAYRDGTAPSIGRGGRYDRLFRRLDCELPAVGFSISVDPLLKEPPAKGRPAMMRLALPKGRNLGAAVDALRAAGLGLAGVDADARQLCRQLPEDDLEVLMLKDWDVPLYVQHGIADFGIVGTDVLEENDGDLLVPVLLREGGSRLSLIGPTAELPAVGSQVRLATKYPNIARQVVSNRPWGAEIFKLQGSVELGPLLDLCEIALDIVQTGTTLRENGLVEVEVISQVNPCLIVNRSSFQRFRVRINELLRRLEEEEKVL